MKVAIIGAGQRAKKLYIPLLKQLPDVELIGICASNAANTKKIATEFNIKDYKSISDVLNDDRIDLIIVCVTWSENAKIYKLLADSDKHVLLETPLGHDPVSIESTYKSLSARSSHTEIAEQYHLRPVEILKRRLIQKGLFGDVFYAFNDGVGHEYHGVSLIRSYLGFDQKLKSALTVQKDVPCFPHKTHSNIFFPGERVQHSILEFESGAMAAYHWSWLNYESPIRARRIAGFHGTMGAVWGEECVVFDNTYDPAVHLRFERRTRIVSGIEVLVSIIVYKGNTVIETWHNPFPNLILNEDQIVAATFIENMRKTINNESKVLYPLSIAYADHLIVNAINESVKY